MASLSKKIGLRKPSISDTVSVDFDISDNMEKIDGALGEKKMVRRVTGLLPITGTAWRKLPTAADTSLDLILKANAGDWIEVAMSGLWSNETPIGALDVCSNPVAGTAVNSWAQKGGVPVAANLGATCWYAHSGSVLINISGSLLKQVVAEDLDANGLLRVSPWGRSGSSGTRNIFGQTELPFEFWAINHGQP